VPSVADKTYDLIGMPRETREGCPLVTVETEVNRDSKSTNERGPSLVGCWCCLAITRDFFMP
jgi:hypothetical protein